MPLNKETNQPSQVEKKKTSSTAESDENTWKRIEHVAALANSAYAVTLSSESGVAAARSSANSFSQQANKMTQKRKRRILKREWVETPTFSSFYFRLSP